MAVTAFPASAITITVHAIAEELSVHKRQGPARQALRVHLRARAKYLKAIGVDASTIELDAQRLAQAVAHALPKKKRIAAAADQVAARIGERRQPAAPMPTPPRPKPISPIFKVMWQNKITLHSTFRDHRAVEAHIDGLMRMAPEAAEEHIHRNLDAMRQRIRGMGLDETTITKFLEDYEGRVRAAYWDRVMSPGQLRRKEVPYDVDDRSRPG